MSKRTRSSNRHQAALIIIDMTRDFLLKESNPGLALERGLELVPRIRTLEDAFLDAQIPVIFATDRHLKGDYELRKWGAHSMKGTRGSKIVDGLSTKGMLTLQRNWKPSDVSEAVKKNRENLLFEVEKGTYSAFTDNGGTPTALGLLLEKLGINAGKKAKLYLTGLHTNCCDKHTAADAWFRGYLPVMVTDCVAAFEDPEGKMGLPHANALTYEKYWYNAELESSKAILEQLSKWKY